VDVDGGGNGVLEFWGGRAASLVKVFVRKYKRSRRAIVKSFRRWRRDWVQVRVEIGKGDARFSWMEEIVDGYFRGDKVENIWVDAPLSRGSGNTDTRETEPIEGSSDLRFKTDLRDVIKVNVGEFGHCVVVSL